MNGIGGVTIQVYGFTLRTKNHHFGKILTCALLIPMHLVLDMGKYFNL